MLSNRRTLRRRLKQRSRASRAAASGASAHRCRGRRLEVHRRRRELLPRRPSGHQKCGRRAHRRVSTALRACTEIVASRTTALRAATPLRRAPADQARLGRRRHRASAAAAAPHRRRNPRCPASRPIKCSAAGERCRSRAPDECMSTRFGARHQKDAAHPPLWSAALRNALAKLGRTNLADRVRLFGALLNAAGTIGAGKPAALLGTANTPSQRSRPRTLAQAVGTRRDARPLAPAASGVTVTAGAAAAPGLPAAPPAVGAQRRAFRLFHC